MSSGMFGDGHSYVQPAYRYEEPQEGRLREFTQAGVELIGPESLDADAESLFTALEALDALGLRDALFDVNHAAIVDGVLAGLELDEAGQAPLRGLTGLVELEPGQDAVDDRGVVHVEERVAQPKRVER